MKKRKWLIYTVMIGLLPLLIRFFISIVSTEVPISYALNEVDLTTFGLILHIANIHELEDKGNTEKIWKTTCIGFSVIMLVLFSILLAIGYFSEASKGTNINKNNLKYSALVLSVVSFIISYSIYDRLNKIENSNG